MIQSAMEALEAMGLPAVRGYPGTWQPELTAPAAAVCLHEQDAKHLTLEVTVFAPPDLGGGFCEDQAMAAVTALEELGAQCLQKQCRFEKSFGLLQVPILATWEETASVPRKQVRVVVNGRILPYLTEVSSRYAANLASMQSVGEGTQGVRWEESAWEITVEQLIPASQVPEVLDYGVFTLILSRPGGTETYTQCRWVHVSRTDESQGIRQVRVARSMDERQVSQ